MPVVLEPDAPGGSPLGRDGTAAASIHGRSALGGEWPEGDHRGRNRPLSIRLLLPLGRAPDDTPDPTAIAAHEVTDSAALP